MVVIEAVTDSPHQRHRPPTTAPIHESDNSEHTFYTTTMAPVAAQTNDSHFMNRSLESSLPNTTEDSSHKSCNR